MANGIRSTDIDAASMVDELLANVTQDGIARTVRVGKDDFAAQLAASGPVQQAIALVDRKIDSAAAGYNYTASTLMELTAIAGTANGQTARVFDDPGGNAVNGVYERAAGVWGRKGPLPEANDVTNLRASPQDVVSGTRTDKLVDPVGVKAALDARSPRKKSWRPGFDVVDEAGNTLVSVTREKIDHPDTNAMREAVANMPDSRQVNAWLPGFDIVDSNGYRLATIDRDRIRHPNIDRIEDRIDSMASQATERLSRLRKTRYKLFRIADPVETGVEQLDIGIFSDSYTFSRGYYSLKFAERLAAVYGQIGPGWVGLAWRSGDPTVGNGAALGATYTYSANFADPNWTSFYRDTVSPSPDLGKVVSSVVGASLAPVAGPSGTTIDSAKLQYFGSGNNEQIRYRWSASDAWTTITLNGVGQQVKALTPPTAGLAWQFTLEVVSGTVSLNGLDLRKTTGKGVRVHKLAATGSALVRDWLPVLGSNFRNAVSALNLDLAVIFLATNDQGENRDPAEFGAGIATMIAQLRLAKPGLDILVVMPAENLGGRAIPMTRYAEEAREAARQSDVGFIDLQSFFGLDPAEYGPAGPVPLIDADLIHPNGATGGRLIVDTIWRALTSSL